VTTNFLSVLGPRSSNRKRYATLRNLVNTAASRVLSSHCLLICSQLFSSFAELTLNNTAQKHLYYMKIMNSTSPIKLKIQEVQLSQTTAQ